MVRPRRSGFDSARACISSLPFKAVPAAGATGATNAAAPLSARAATIFCIVPVLRRGRGGLFSRPSPRVVSLGRSVVLVSAQPQRLCGAPGDRDRSVGAEWVPRPPQAGAAFSQASEASPPANWNRCRASARYVSDTQPWMIDGAKLVVSGPLEALFALRRRLMTSI